MNITSAMEQKLYEIETSHTCERLSFLDTTERKINTERENARMLAEELVNTQRSLNEAETTLRQLRESTHTALTEHTRRGYEHWQKPKNS